MLSFKHSGRRLLSIWLHLALFFFSLAGDGESEEAIEFDISAGNAQQSIPLFVEITKKTILYDFNDLADIELNSVKGLLSPKNALLSLIEDTPLVLNEDEVPGIWVLRKVDPVVPDDYEIELPKLDSDFDPESIFELSPFVVTESGNMGYLSTQTLAGTRIKTSLENIATMLQVVTPEFMEDTQATDISTLGPYLANFESNRANPMILGFVDLAQQP
jgi:hypothetical protein